MTTASKPAGDAVDLAAAALDRAVGRLIALLGGEDPAPGREAMRALMRLGPEAEIAHPGAALGRHRKDPPLRRRIASAVAAFGLLSRESAAAVLIEHLRIEEDPGVVDHVGVALASLGPFPGPLERPDPTRPGVADAPT